MEYKFKYEANSLWRKIMSVHSLFDPVMNRGLMNLMAFFNEKGVKVELSQPPVMRDEFSYKAACTVSLRICDAVVKDGFNDNARNVSFQLRHRELRHARLREPRTLAYAYVDTAAYDRKSADLLEPRDIPAFAEAILQTLRNRNMTDVPTLKL